ncbi:MAG: hypothetical protein NZ890_20675, partial [Myxococcota bacterium]|nr:hypothetical protein [Myxococcota bacterium]
MSNQNAGKFPSASLSTSRPPPLPPSQRSPHGTPSPPQNESVDELLDAFIAQAHRTFTSVSSTAWDLQTHEVEVIEPDDLVPVDSVSEARTAPTRPLDKPHRAPGSERSGRRIQLEQGTEAAADRIQPTPGQDQPGARPEVESVAEHVPPPGAPSVLAAGRGPGPGQPSSQQEAAPAVPPEAQEVSERATPASASEAVEQVGAEGVRSEAAAGPAGPAAEQVGAEGVRSEAAAEPAAAPTQPCLTADQPAARADQAAAEVSPAASARVERTEVVARPRPPAPRTGVSPPVMILGMVGAALLAVALTRYLSRSEEGQAQRLPPPPVTPAPPPQAVPLREPPPSAVASPIVRAPAPVAP